MEQTKVLPSVEERTDLTGANLKDAILEGEKPGESLGNSEIFPARPFWRCTIRVNGDQSPRRACTVCEECTAEVIQSR